MKDATVIGLGRTTSAATAADVATAASALEENDNGGYNMDESIAIPAPKCAWCGRIENEIDVQELAERAGLKTYDTALPLDWYEDVHAKTGYWPQHFGFVWCYDSPKVWGVPYPLTQQAQVLLDYYNAMLKVCCPGHSKEAI